MTLKIMHVAETIKGGVGTYLKTFDDICGEDFLSSFVVPREHVDQLGPGKDVVTFPRPKRGLRAVAAMGRATERQARIFDPDIIFCHSTYALAALAWMRVRRSRARLVYCPHGWAQLRYPDQAFKRALVRACEGRLLSLSDLVLNIAKNDRRMAKEQKYKGRHVVVENAMPDLQKRPGANPYASDAGGLDLLFVGRFERQKGLDILLEAFATARKANPALTLHVVGAGVDEQVDLPEHLKAGIHFHGWVPATEIASYYAAADMVIMPSRWEGLPMVLIEALRASTPIMLADVSGMGELIEDDRSGIVLPELSSGALAKALSDLSAGRLKTMRSGARELYERRYGPDRFRCEMRDIFAALSSAGPSEITSETLNRANS